MQRPSSKTYSDLLTATLKQQQPKIHSKTDTNLSKTEKEIQSSKTQNQKDQKSPPWI
jgi:hypothetical protein